MTAVSRSPIPVWVVTGPLGVGKTTVIARLLADKPATEDWVVLLNEFTDAGIDALTVAAAARGAFDVRLVPGGCLCCAGEADFRRTLLELINERRPTRIVVEPSGIGHPIGIVEELLAHEARGDLHLEWVLALLDASRLDALQPNADSVAAAAVQIADALALTKADTSDEAALHCFRDGVGYLYPPKRWFGAIRDGQLPADFFESLTDDTDLTQRRAGFAKAADRSHHEATVAVADERLPVGEGERLSVYRLGRHGARWEFPRKVAFSRRQIVAVFAAGAAPLGEAAGRLERFKAVLRVAEEEWVLVQWSQGVLSMSDTAWRRDNRIELQCVAGSRWSVDDWDRLWLRCQVS